MIPPATAGLAAHLRPRDVAGIIDQSFRLYRKHFLVLLAIASIVYVPTQIAIEMLRLALIGPASDYLNSTLRDLSSGNFSSTTTRNELFINQGLYTAATYLLIALQSAVLTLSMAATAAVVIDSYEDRPISFAGSYRQALKRPGPLLGVMLIILLVNVGINGLSGISGLSSLMISNPAATTLFCLFLPIGLAAFVFAIRYRVSLALAVPALITENLGAREALRRSTGLVKGSWWRTAALLIVLAILASIVDAGPAALVTALVTIFVKFDLLLNQAVTGVVTTLTGMIFTPIELVAVTLYYLDLRVRKEAFDLEAAIARAFPESRPPQYGDYPQADPAYGAGVYGQPPAGITYSPVLGYVGQGGDSYGAGFAPAVSAETRVAEDAAAAGKPAGGGEEG